MAIVGVDSGSLYIWGSVFLLGLGLAATWCRSTFIKWTRWTLAMALYRNYYYLLFLLFGFIWGMESHNFKLRQTFVFVSRLTNAPGAASASAVATWRGHVPPRKIQTSYRWFYLRSEVGTRSCKGRAEKHVSYLQSTNLMQALTRWTPADDCDVDKVDSCWWLWCWHGGLLLMIVMLTRCTPADDCDVDKVDSCWWLWCWQGGLLLMTVMLTRCTPADDCDVDTVDSCWWLWCWQGGLLLMTVMLTRYTPADDCDVDKVYSCWWL